MWIELLSNFVAPIVVGLGAVYLGHRGSTKRLQRQLEADREAHERERAAERQRRRASQGVAVAQELISMVRQLGQLAAERRSTKKDQLYEEILPLLLLLPKPQRARVSLLVDAMVNAHEHAEVHYLDVGEIIGMAMAHAVTILHAVQREEEGPELPDWLHELQALGTGTGRNWQDNEEDRAQRRARWLQDHPDIAEQLRDVGRDVPDVEGSD